ncbi:MAG TPA: glycerophosphodiester phosphodiesterase [Acidimicrobiaceae bacterium]|nr:glycerophosphodiester phosphodiesterase [Acidimicrobiaceae bacterium]HAZ56857.1 glycerophosphodiester phosphodiesterase [Acidimicrobiaceae bacterium]
MSRSAERPREPILFAHRGGRAHAPESSLQAFETAIRMGATGLEGDVWCTADGVPVLHHDRRVGSALRRRPITALRREHLPDGIPTLEDLYRRIDGGVPLSLDIRDTTAIPAVLEVARRHSAVRSLWLCHSQQSVLAGIRETERDVVLVHSTRIERINEGPERMAADLSNMAIDAVNLPEQDWSAGLVALFRRFGLRCLGWDAQHPRQIDRLIALRLDGIYGDHVDRLVEGLANRRVRP